MPKGGRCSRLDLLVSMALQCKYLRKEKQIKKQQGRNNDNYQMAMSRSAISLQQGELYEFE